MLIDEYDRVPSLLIIDRPERYTKALAGTVEDPGLRPIRCFFEALTCANVRSFTTGILPIPLADSSSNATTSAAARAINDLTHDPSFGAMCGLREQDIRRGLVGVLGEGHEAIDRVLKLMSYYYNGYRFCAEGGVTEPLYNSQQCLYFLDKLACNPNFQGAVVDTWSHDPKTAAVTDLIDRNVAVSDIVTCVVEKDPMMLFVQAALSCTTTCGDRGTLMVNLEGKLCPRELLEHTSRDNVNRLALFFFHHGLVTLKAPGEIVIPNCLVENVKKFQVLQPFLGKWNIDVVGLVSSPTEETLWNLLNKALSFRGAQFRHEFSEGAIVGCIAAVVLDFKWRHGCDVQIAVETKSPRSHDLYLKYDQHMLLLKIMRLRSAKDGDSLPTVLHVKPEEWNRHSRNPTWRSDQALLSRDYELSEEGSRVFDCKTVLELLKRAEQQCLSLSSIGLKV